MTEFGGARVRDGGGVDEQDPVGGAPAAPDGPEAHPMTAVNEPIVVEDWERPAAFHVSERRFDSAGLILSVHGELDIATVGEFRERLDAAVDGGTKRLVLDLSPVTFMDSVAIAAVLHVRTRLGDEGRLAVVVPQDSYTQMVFEIAGLPRCLEIHETLEETIAKLRLT